VARTIIGTFALLVLGLRGVAIAQDRPFVFSITTAPPVDRPQARVDVDFGVGEQAFRASSAKGPEQRIGVHATAGRWTFLGRFGLASIDSQVETSQQGEVLFTIRATGVTLAAGGGLLHEAGGTNVLLARVAGGRGAKSWRADGNVLFQKPLEEGRDAVDMIVSGGWGRKLGRSHLVGLEAIGEDLEGFWEANEAEGGARLLVGPSWHLAPPDRRWQLSVVGGPVFRATSSGRANDALRDLPPVTNSVSYAVKMSFSASF
jgi:hypothetical protein